MNEHQHYQTLGRMEFTSCVGCGVGMRREMACPGADKPERSPIGVYATRDVPQGR